MFLACIYSYANGQNWKEITYPYSDNVRFLSVAFPSVDTGFICGTDGRILRTINGGLTWDSLTSNIKYELESIVFVDNNTGFAAGGDTIIKTINGGNTWSIDTTIDISNYIFGMYFNPKDSGYIVGTNGLIMKYSNHRWNITNPSIGSDLYSVFFTNRDTGYCVGGFSAANHLLQKQLMQGCHGSQNQHQIIIKLLVYFSLRIALAMLSVGQEILLKLMIMAKIGKLCQVLLQKY